MRGHKFHAVKTVCAEGHTHPSKTESAKCDDLHRQQCEGLITHLTREPVFPIIINGKVVCKYVADFQYRMADSGLSVVMDVKGVRTRIFDLKKKMVEAAYPGVVIAVWPPKKKKPRKKRVAKSGKHIAEV